MPIIMHMLCLFGNRQRKILASLFLVTLLFCSCSKNRAPRIDIGNDFYYWESTEASTLGDALRNAAEFKKLEDKSEHNLMRMFGSGRHYVWIRAEFEIPPELKNQPLGLVVPHLRFAAQGFCNGTVLANYGNFPPRERSNFFKAAFFSFPVNILNQNGKNIFLMKVFSYGDAGISSHAFIQHIGLVYTAQDQINFTNSRIYMIFFGIMFLTFILYLCLYTNSRRFKEFRDFSLLNLATSICLCYFFATELPLYTSGMISHLNFAKFIFCIPGYLLVYLSGVFAADFFTKKTPLALRVTRILILAVQVIPTLFATSYDFLLKVSSFMMALVIVQVGTELYELGKNLIIKESRERALQVFVGFTPFFIGIAIDITVRMIDNTQSYPYFLIFGWQGMILIFIIMLSIRFSKVFNKNEQLSDHLLEEVASRTHELQDANKELSELNEQLAKDKKHAEMDLEMAALVQRNFFPRPNKNFKGWEISVCYSPQSKVSGDFYDYYNFNDILNGISLFDVSGHGLSASLVTMLSKNIISRVFQTGFRRNERIDKVLTKINSMILSEKGDIDNYMTGILCRFNDCEDSSRCSVELGNAGHPYPLKFSVHDKEIYELKGNDGKKHYGAIGMKGITVSFARSNFFMQTGDILILYTDGLTEATNPNQDQFGIEQIKEIIKENHARSTSELVGLIIERLEAFTEYRPFEDDITLIIAKRKNSSEYVKDEEHEDNFDDVIEELEEV